MESIEKILDFIIEIEKLKDIHRKTKPVGLERFENSAEHSWHVCLSALVLKEYANEEINIDRVIKMLLIHDLGEIDAGDTIIYKSETQENKESEENGVKRLLGYLPVESQTEYMSLWHEFESGETSDSKYARAIDRIPPLLHNLHGDGHSWNRHGISKEKIISVNSRIKEGSKTVWDVIESRLTEAFANGILK
ncbi:MAG: HD domain-containing protein [Candidatus Thiodiazotropha sp.]